LNWSVEIIPKNTYGEIFHYNEKYIVSDIFILELGAATSNFMAIN